MSTTRILGTITGAFDGAPNGMAARLVRVRRLGYTVELLASRPPFQHGDLVHLSPAEFLKDTTPSRSGQRGGASRTAP